MEQDNHVLPPLDNDSTHGEAFWKSTRKVLAANTGLYNKLTGQDTDLEKTSIDLTREDTAEEWDMVSSPIVANCCGQTSAVR